jgi:hypothetical protein
MMPLARRRQRRYEHRREGFHPRHHIGTVTVDSGTGVCSRVRMCVLGPPFLFGAVGDAACCAPF